MPQRLGRACRLPDCPHPATPYGSRCAVHEAPKRQHDSQRYGLADWKQLRARHLSQYPLCGMGPDEQANRAASVCLQTNRVSIATDVDHIQAVDIAPSRRLDPSNLRSLCHTCHARRTLSEARR